MNIHPYLIARLYHVQEAFYATWQQIPLYYPEPYTSHPPPTNNTPLNDPFSSLPPHDDETETGDDGDEGGGGTLKGLRVTEPKSSNHRP